LPTIPTHHPHDEDKLRALGPIELFHLCAADKNNPEAWTEFLRRYAVKLKYFIAGTLRQYGKSSSGSGSVLSGGHEESDLFQNAIIRLVENDCSAMKRFSGTEESELLAYLAVICRSSVLDSLRRDRAARRGFGQESGDEVELNSLPNPAPANSSEFERRVLIREILDLTQHTIESRPNPLSERDRLIFDLHFFQGLSFSQISQCSGIKLSKSGVEKLLGRLISRVQVLASAGKSSELL
jgi:RNA polymerase sigma factor (sigma-70 family)